MTASIDSRRFFCYFLAMIKTAVFLLFLFSVPCSTAYGFEVSGPQPLAPNGVFSTFGANMNKKGVTALAVALEMSNDPDYYRYSVQAAYGITDDIELSLNLPYVHEWRDERSGFEDFALGFRHRFVDEGKYGPSLAYLVTASFENGKEGFSAGGRLGAGLIVTKRAGPVLGHVNFILSKPGDSDLQEEIAFLAGLDFSASHNFKVLAELYVRKTHFSDELDQAEARLGYRIKTDENFYTTVGLGYDLKDRAPEYRLMVTATMLFSFEKKAVRKIYEEEK